MISIYHNIVWSKYKGEVFSNIFELSKKQKIDFRFFQIAETESDRIGLGGVDMNYHRYPFKLFFSGSYDSVPKFKLFFELFKFVLKDDSKLILLPGYHKFEYFLMLLACKIKNKKVGVFCDSTKYDRPRSYFKGLVKRFFFRLCDVYFGYGQRSREYLLMYGANSKNIFARCQAAALPRNYDVVVIPNLRRNLVSSSPRFLYVGRLSPEKNLLTLISAFSEFVKKYKLAQLVIVGSGAQKDQLVNFSNSIGLMESNINFAGSKSLDDLRDEYLKATALVLPSISEPWGLVVNEALSYGCPVLVSSHCGCVPELVKSGVTGYFFNPFDVSQIIDSMDNILKNFSDVDSVTFNCLQHISEYDPENAAQQIIDGCITVLGN